MCHHLMQNDAKRYEMVQKTMYYDAKTDVKRCKNTTKHCEKDPKRQNAHPPPPKKNAG